MKHIKISRGAIVALLAVLSIGHAGQASADEGVRRAPDLRPCVTRGEWRSVRVEMPRAQVEEILDGPGRRMGEHYRTYVMCDVPRNDALLLTRYGSRDRLWQALAFDFSRF